MSTAATTAPPSNVRIVSYNVLSSKLSRSSHFTHADPEHLEYEYRLPLILAKLEEEMTRGLGSIEGNNDGDSSAEETTGTAVDSTKTSEVDDATTTAVAAAAAAPPTIFCLQEICYPFSSALHTFFAQKGYHFVTGLYGKKFNGYMGIGIAYPMKDFDTIKVDIARLSDDRDGGWPRPPPPPTTENDEQPKITGNGETTTTTSTTTTDGDAKYDVTSITEARGNETLVSFDKLQITSAENKNSKRLQKIVRQISESLEKFTANTVRSTVDFVRNRIDKPLGVKFRLALGLPPLAGEKEQVIDPWDMSENRFNVLLTVVLRYRHCYENDEYGNSSNGMFSVSNYHMPCAFFCPPVMNIHAEMAARRVQDLAADAWKVHQNDDGETSASSLEQPTTIPYIFAGDFNILPESPHYNLFTTAMLDKSDPTYPPPKHGMEWKIGSVAMDSAYALKGRAGSEPEFTNYAHVKEDEDPFIGTLDYIFLSQKEQTSSGSSSSSNGAHWKVCGIKKLPSTAASGGPFPNKVEPSDHLLIAADLELV